MEYLIKIASDLGIFAIAAYFIQKIVDNSANRRLEEFKNTLSIIQSKQTILHNKRLEIIEKIYSHLVDLNSAMYYLTHPVKQSSIDHKEYDSELTEKASKCFNLFNSYYQKNKIYFSEQTCKIIDELIQNFNQAFWDYNEHKYFENNRYGPYTDDEIASRKKMLTAYTSVKDEIPIVRKRLEREFRDLLKVE